MWVVKFGEFGEDFHDLVGTFSTCSDNHDVGLSLLADSVLQHGLARTERSWYEASSALSDGIESVDGSDSRLQQFERTGLSGVVGHGELHGPVLYHVHLEFRTVLFYKHSHGVGNLIRAFCHDALDFRLSLHLERNHDFQRLAVFDDFSEPVGSDHHVAHLCNRSERPFTILIEGISVLAALEEYPLHLVEVVLQSIVVLRQHSRGQFHLEHVSREIGHSPDLQSSGALEHLDIDILAHDLDDLRHQTVATCLDVANFSLCYRTVNFQGHHIGDNATNSTFSHVCYSVFLCYF